MKASMRRKLAQRKRRIEKRLERENWPKHSGPVMEARNIDYELAGRAKGTSVGGMGAFHRMAVELGLARDMNANPHLLKIHKPYHESDHVLNLCYNVLVGGARLEEIELLRQDEAIEVLGNSERRVGSPSPRWRTSGKGRARG